MSGIQMKCRTCGKVITKETGIPAGYCNECVEATDKLLATLDKMIPYGSEEQ